MTTLENTRARAQKLPIGVLSRETGVNIETIRYYERIGLMPKPPRSDGGHRLYDNEHRRRLIFIRRARELGFALDDIRHLLGLERSQSLTCDDVKALTEQHIREIHEKIRDLQKLKRALSELTAQCHGGEVPACPILDTLGAIQSKSD
jgi:MerR family mercuric resistance operon transcriptional regulator